MPRRGGKSLLMNFQYFGDHFTQEFIPNFTFATIPPQYMKLLGNFLMQIWKRAARIREPPQNELSRSDCSSVLVGNAFYVIAGL